jgi:Kef-type K+ transport system membrane component KefB
MKKPATFHYIFFSLIIILTAVPLLAAASGNSGGNDMIGSVGIAILAAIVLAFIGHILKQPLILAYIAAGIIIGPRIGLGLIRDMNDIENISHFGLILLLFSIGLEIDINKLKASRRSVVITGLLQFPICFLMGIGFFYLLGSPSEGGYDLAYLAACCALSSTAIVVKLLYGKFELDTLAGRLSLGILVFQNIWVIMILRMQPNLSHIGALGMLISLCKAGMLVLLCMLASKYLLPRFFRRIAKVPELVLIASLGWCFCICTVASHFNLSLEMAALIAGVSISTFPYNLDVIAKVINIRDFFVTLFFVSIGMQIPDPLDNPGLLLTAGMASAFLISSRFFTIFPLLFALKNSIRVGLLSSINLSQLSEFSLIIASIGLTDGHIAPDTFTVVIFVFVITSVISTYAIKHNDPIQKALAAILRTAGLREIQSGGQDKTISLGKEIALLGFHRSASALIHEIIAYDHGIKAPDSIKDKVVVIDFNPEIYRSLKVLGIDVIYGDISNPETLQHAGIHDVRIVISTIPDTMLVGIDNLRIIRYIKEICPRARIIVTAETAEGALKMYADGADYVFIPHVLSARNVLGAVEMFLKDDQKEIMSRINGDIEMLKNRTEIMH